MGKHVVLAEVRRVDGWVTIDTQAARGERTAMFRCPSCHGQVFLYRSYAPGSTSHFSHKRAYAKCMPGQGPTDLHPEALS